MNSEYHHLHRLLGAGALKGGRNKLEELKKDFDAWVETTEGADSPKKWLTRTACFDRAGRS